MTSLDDRMNSTQVVSNDGSCIVCAKKFKFMQVLQKVVVTNHRGEKGWAWVHKKCGRAGVIKV